MRVLQVKDRPRPVSLCVGRAQSEPTYDNAANILTPYEHAGFPAQGRAHRHYLMKASLTNSNASVSNSPGAGASPHTGFSAGMTPSAGTASGTADGTTATGATSRGSGKQR
jgi:hypothetical protein